MWKILEGANDFFEQQIVVYASVFVACQVFAPYVHMMFALTFGTSGNATQLGPQFGSK